MPHFVLGLRKPSSGQIGKRLLAVARLGYHLRAVRQVRYGRLQCVIVVGVEASRVTPSRGPSACRALDGGINNRRRGLSTTSLINQLCYEAWAGAIRLVT